MSCKICLVTSLTRAAQDVIRFVTYRCKSAKLRPTVHISLHRTAEEARSYTVAPGARGSRLLSRGQNAGGIASVATPEKRPRRARLQQEENGSNGGSSFRWRNLSPIKYPPCTATTRHAIHHRSPPPRAEPRFILRPLLSVPRFFPLGLCSSLSLSSTSSVVRRHSVHPPTPSPALVLLSFIADLRRHWDQARGIEIAIIAGFLRGPLFPRSHLSMLAALEARIARCCRFLRPPFVWVVAVVS